MVSRGWAHATPREAARIATRFGFPVAMKGVAPHLPHKSDLGLVRLNVADVRAAGDAFDELARTLTRRGGGEVVVQEMAGDGVELILGIRNDPAFGSFVVVGPVGLLVEVANQTSVRRGPVDVAQARAMLADTSAAKLLAGVRGKGPWDAEAAASAIAAFSRFGAAQLPVLGTIEVKILSSSGAMES